MRHFFIKLLAVLIGGAIQGLGMGAFLFPHAIPSGGAGGVTVLCNYFFHIDYGLCLWLVNFSLIIFGVRYLGKRFAVWTVIGITMTSIAVSYFGQLNLIQDRNFLFDVLAGSVFLGTGIGLLMRFDVSNGGIGVLALIMSKSRNILPGKPLFYINSFIFLFVALVIDWKLIFLTLFSQWISSKMVDLVCQVNFDRIHPLH